MGCCCGCLPRLVIECDLLGVVDLGHLVGPTDQLPEGVLELGPSPVGNDAALGRHSLGLGLGDHEGLCGRRGCGLRDPLGGDLDGRELPLVVQLDLLRGPSGATGLTGHYRPPLVL